MRPLHELGLMMTGSIRSSAALSQGTNQLTFRAAVTVLLIHPSRRPLRSFDWAITQQLYVV